MKTYHKGKLIVIEGGDGSGKATQTRLLVNSLSNYGNVSTFEFPRYKQSTFGELIGRCLAGEFGNFLELSPYLSSLPYILDRARAKYLLLESLKEGHVVCDRYTPSNIAHQAVKLPEEKREEFIEFLESGEYEELGLPVPDLVVYLYVPPREAQSLIENKKKRDYLAKAGEKDLHEANVQYQEDVSSIFKKLCSERQNWKMIDCMKNGNLLSREEVHLKVIKTVKQFLKLK
jgi:dTMP kinase